MLRNTIYRPCKVAQSLIATRVIVPTTQRQIHSTSVSRDLLSWFTGKKAFDPEDEGKVINTKKTDEFISDVEKNKKVSNDENLAVDLEIIGKPVEVDTWRYEKNGFNIKQWKNQEDARLSVGDETEAITAIKASFERLDVKDVTGQQLLEFKLENLLERFRFIKEFTVQTGINIPDYVLTTIQTPGDLLKYLNTKVIGVTFDEKSPKAIFLDQADFVGTNITIVDTDKARKIKKDNWNELVRKATELDIKESQSKIDAALNQ